jgi:hypothetical protein
MARRLPASTRTRDRRGEAQAVGQAEANPMSSGGATTSRCPSKAVKIARNVEGRCSGCATPPAGARCLVGDFSIGGTCAEVAATSVPRSSCPPPVGRQHYEQARGEPGELPDTSAPMQMILF